MLINIDHECNAIYVERNFDEKLPKIGTREQERHLSLMIYLIFMYNFPTDNSYKFQLTFRLIIINIDFNKIFIPAPIHNIKNVTWPKKRYSLEIRQKIKNIKPVFLDTGNFLSFFSFRSNHN